MKTEKLFKEIRLSEITEKIKNATITNEVLAFKFENSKSLQAKRTYIQGRMKKLLSEIEQRRFNSVAVSSFGTDCLESEDGITSLRKFFNEYIKALNVIKEQNPSFGLKEDIVENATQASKKKRVAQSSCRVAHKSKVKITKRATAKLRKRVIKTKPVKSFNKVFKKKRTKVQVSNHSFRATGSSVVINYQKRRRV